MNRSVATVIIGVVSLSCVGVSAQSVPTPDQSADPTRLAVLRGAKPERVVAHSATGGVTMTARCAEGYVSSKTYRPSKETVQIVSERPVSCDGSRCRALQVVAKSADGSPFDFEMVVTCAS